MATAPKAPKPPDAPALAVKLGDVVLDRYRVVEQIASGGHSVVFRGLDERLARPVCIKVFSGFGRNSGVGRTSYEHFVQEAFALSRLTHPNTLRIYDFGHLGTKDAEGMPLQVCEYMNGGTLSQIIREQGPQPLAEAARITQAMCLALGEAHGLGIVHRDIKPQNILFGAVGNARLPKLADFGIAKWSADEENREKRAEDTAIVAGQKLAMYSPSWAAPEQLAGQPVSPATDIYSLACVAVYMLSTKAIFADEDVYAGYKKRRHSDELVVAALEPLGVPAAVIQLLVRALAFDPKRRLAEVEQLATGLATALAPEEPVRPSPVELPPPPLAAAPAVAPVTWAAEAPPQPLPLPPPHAQPTPPPHAQPTPPPHAQPTPPPHALPAHAAPPSSWTPPPAVQPWMAAVAAPQGRSHRLGLSDLPQHVGDRRVHFLHAQGSVADLLGGHNTKVRVTFLSGPGGARVLHVKGLTCFVAHLGGRPSPAVQVDQPGDIALVTPRAQEIGHFRIATGTPAMGEATFPLGAELVAVSADDCMDPILFDFGPGLDAYFVYTRGRPIPRTRRSLSSHMSSSPPSPPPGSPQRPPHGPLSEDYADFEGDPTSINQIPQSQLPPRPAANMHPQPVQPPPGQFASASPQLSHIGGQYGTNPGLASPGMQPSPIPGAGGGMTMTALPGPPMSQVSGVIAQATPYVSRSRIYAFVVDETGLPIELGSGRFAKCYLGEERWVESKTTLRRPVAIKALQRGVSSEDQMRFQMEKEILERVQGHPNIVELLGSGEGDSAGFIPPVIRDRVENDFMILELLDMSLEERLKGARQKRRRDDLLAVPLRERIFRVLEYIIPVATAVEFSHLVRDTCHRDIKPANILVKLPDPNLRGSQMKIKLADFNVGKVNDPDLDVSMTRFQAVPGTLYFQSPEQETNTFELLVNCTQGSPEVEFFEDFYIDIYENDSFALFNRNEMYSIAAADRTRKKILLNRPFAEASEINVRGRVVKSVGRPADIYSLGAVFYYLISGAYANPKNLFDAFRKFVEYEKRDENNSIAAYIDHEYRTIQNIRAPKAEGQGAPELAPEDRFFSYKHYLDGNGELIDPMIMMIIAKAMIRNKPDSYCLSYDLRTTGISSMVHDLLSLYVAYGIDPSARIAYSNEGYQAPNKKGGAMRRAFDKFFKK